MTLVVVLWVHMHLHVHIHACAHTHTETEIDRQRQNGGQTDRHRHTGRPGLRTKVSLLPVLSWGRAAARILIPPHLVLARPFIKGQC